MHTAYLILAHHQPAHLARLLRALAGDQTCCFVHVDAKAELASFAELAPSSQVKFLEGSARVRVRWGGFSIVAATLNLLRAATRSGVPFTRYSLLSGSDFPLKSNAKIAEAFSTSWEFLRVDRRLDYAARDWHSAGVKYHHLYDNRLLNPKTTPSGRLTAAAARLLRAVPRRRYRHIPLFQGSQWWALTDQCVRYVMAFLDRNEDYLAFHRHTRVPDETFFHSIVKSSPFGDSIFQDAEKPEASLEPSEPHRHGCHYVDWDHHRGERPKVLDLSDFDALRSSTALFARKFEEPTSAELRSRLEDRFA